jgi:signal transduction histidine kinase
MAHAGVTGVKTALAWRNWSVSWRLIAVAVIAIVLDMVLGGLRMAAAADSVAGFDRVTQLASLGQQVTGLAQALENERDQTAGFIAAGRPPPQSAAIQQAYLATDAQAGKVRALAAGIGTAFPADTRANVTDVLDRISDLRGLRDAALHTDLPSLPVIIDYSQSVGDLFALNDEIAQGSADSALADSVRALGSLSRMQEQASQQRALLFAALTERRFEPGALQDLISAQSAQASDLAAFLTSATLGEQQDFDNTVTGPLLDQARLMEQHVIALGSPTTAGIGINASLAPLRWYSAISATIGAMHAVEARLAASIVTSSRALRQGPERSALLTGVLTATVLILVLIATLVVSRSLVLPLRRLKAGALEIATVGLPARIQQISEAPDPDARLDVAPISVHSTDEIGQVARAFDLVHEQAVRLAGNEAIVRRNVSAMFVSLSRRSQSMVERLTQVMESARQEETDPGRLSELSAMNRLVTRMRRNSENLMVMAGYETVRMWSGPVSLTNVVQAAVSEIERPGRVALNIQQGIAIAGLAATDIAHVLAELAENASNYSPRDTQVLMAGYELPNGGVVVDITDNGIGVSPARLAEMNARLDNPPAADVAVSRHMGLFVVAHLSARHGIRVRLTPAQPHGLTALVWLPAAVARRDFSVPEGGPEPELANGDLRVGGYMHVSGPPLSAGLGAAEQSMAEAARARLSAFQRGSRRAEKGSDESAQS